MKNTIPNVLVAYASEHGSTKEIANNIADGIDGNTSVRHVNRIENMNYDYIVLGTPIYDQQPVEDMNTFVQKFKNELEGAKKSAFVVASDIESVNKKVQNISSFINKIPGKIDVTEAFAGGIDTEELSRREKSSVEAYLNSIDEPATSYSKIDIVACKEFGRKISLQL